MTTLQERYCATRRCASHEFGRNLFWRCLHWRALPVALIWPAFFAPDRELIVLAGRARNLHELNEEIRDFVHDSRNLTWWRRRAHLRLSTRRLRVVARPYLSAPLPLPLEKSRQRAA